MNRNATISLVVGLLLTAAACSDDGDSAEMDTREPGNEQSSDEESAESTGQGDADTSEGSEQSATGEPLGTTQARVDAPNGKVSVRVDVMGLSRNGEHVELALQVTNEESESDLPNNDQLYWPPYFTFADETRSSDASTSDYDASGIGLVDQVAQKMYLPAVDSAEVCVCTGDDLLRERVYPGQTIDVVATYGGVPADLETVDVNIPDFPVVESLQIGG